ncbi:MAG: DUF4252 domain-containing protein [Candidatus Krumholzibacteria bacterium]|nr:DUF4252 domain-containing protein [Candidatus Krumholzibacteria bacterium]
MERNYPERARRGALVAILGLSLAAAPGCLWAPELSGIQREIERQLPGADFDKEFALSLGPVTLGLARLVTALVPGGDEARGYLRDVSRVQVAVYNVHSVPSTGSLQMPGRMQRMLDDGWEIAVRAREDDSAVWVLYRIEGDAVRDLCVVALDDEELVLVKARGRLERVVGRALAEAEGVPGVPSP